MRRNAAKRPLYNTIAALARKSAIAHLIILVRKGHFRRPQLPPCGINDLVNVMTPCATATLPILLITGYCGMNFDNLPSIHYKYGVLGATGMITVLAVVLLLLFKKTGRY